MDENESNASSNIFEQARITNDNEPKADGPERELLVFGEGDGRLSKDGGVRYTKPKFGYFIIAGLVGVILGAALTLLMVSRIAGGLSNLRLISYMGKYDSSVISELLARIDAVHFGETPDAQTLIDKASHALVDAMEDPYASYYTDEEYNAYNSSFNGNYYGIGILVQNPDGTGALIRRVYEGSFAEKAGLLKDDLIIRVDGEDITETTGTDLVNRITGDEGTTVEIAVRRGEEELTFTVERGAVYIKRVDSFMLENNIGYLYLSSFSGNAVSEFQHALEDFKSKGVTKLIVDLRDNPGGSLTIVNDSCDLLLPECVICSMQGKTTDPTEYFRSDAEMYDFEFVVLVNEYSASASEIFAGAMQDNGRAKIIGTQTYGKGVVQTTFKLDADHGWLKLTTDAYFTPNGTNLGGTGITPDIAVELPEELRNYDIYTLYSELMDRDTQLKAAIDALN